MTARPLIPWEVVERRKLVQSSFLTIWEDRVRLASGLTIDDFCVIQSPDWAGVLCITRELEVVLVRQYRHGIRGESLELPAGALEREEAPLAGAQRELLEETGYCSSHWQHILTACVDPARQTTRAHFYCAMAAEQTAAPRLDASEDLQTLRVPKQSLMELIETGRLVHGLHIAAILTAERGGLI